MGWQFRKSFKILPGVRLNVGKRGVTSISAGVRGAHVTTGRRGTWLSTGVRGTGLSYRQKLSGSTRGRQVNGGPPRRSPLGSLIKLAVIGIAIIIGIAVLRGPTTPPVTPLNATRAVPVANNVPAVKAVEANRTVPVAVPAAPAPVDREATARAKFNGALANGRQLVKLRVYPGAREQFQKIVDGAPGTAIAAEAQKELDAIAAVSPGGPTENQGKVLEISSSSPVKATTALDLESPDPTTPSAADAAMPTAGSGTYVGPRGGVYHYSKSGKKVYEKRHR